MELPFAWSHLAWLGAAIALELGAEVCLKLADGFRRRGWGFAGLGLVVGAFACLGRASEGIPLSIAYALWGAFGLVAVVLAGRWLFGQRLTRGAWLGLALIATGTLLLQMF